MSSFSRFVVGAAISLSFIAPLTASAAGLSFGGRVLSVLPCLNGGLYTAVVSARALTLGITEFYIWTPLTLTLSFGPPRPGVQILGIADVPYACVISIHPPIVLPGLRMQMIGTSGIF